MFYNWQIRSSKNFLQNNAVQGLFLKSALGTRLSVCLSVCLSACLYVCKHVCIYVCTDVCIITWKKWPLGFSLCCFVLAFKKQNVFKWLQERNRNMTNGKQMSGWGWVWYTLLVIAVMGSWIHNLVNSVCNFQSMKGPVEVKSLSSKFFCYIS